LWAHRYWPARYWPTRYWTGGASAPATTLTAATGQFVLTGNPVTTRTNRLVAQTGQFALTGSPTSTFVSRPHEPLPQEIPEAGGHGDVIVIRRHRRRH
jgi:hypothetical protein